MNLEFMCRYYDGKAFVNWLAGCYNRGFNHGFELTMAHRGPDNVYAAEKFLKLAESEGLIKRPSTPTPTKEQNFFNVQAANCSKKFSNALRGETEYGWEPTDKTSSRLLELIKLVDTSSK